MTFSQQLTAIGERWPWPDFMSRAAISSMVGNTDRRLSGIPAGSSISFARDMERYPIALHTDAANAQHYEVPPEFFKIVLGPRLKYSSAFFETGKESLGEAEEIALAKTVDNAALVDGQHILELGCGWGSLSLWMAEHFPKSRITSVSNSSLQRGYIEGEALKRGFKNLKVITADMNNFDIDQTFDRVVSVEMFEHMSNWPALLSRVRKWLKPQGRALIHVFTHRSAPYRFDHTNPDDWIAAHFFTGGIMPSHDLMRACSRDLEVEAEWQWNGENYKRTADFWLANMDAHRTEVDAILRQTYGKNASLWRRRWRLFFLATSGLFGHAQGKSWGISHYRLKPVKA